MEVCHHLRLGHHSVSSQHVSYNEACHLFYCGYLQCCCHLPDDSDLWSLKVSGPYTLPATGRRSIVGQAGSDKLVLQYLNNQRYDYSALKAAIPFGQKLIEYVCLPDPDGSGTSAQLLR